MRRKPLAGIAALGLAILLWVGAGPARAIEVELPGERRLDIHGFYELRLKEFGEDTPNANLRTLSQFRHVVSIETELGIFPEGIGPFDTMMSFTRWTISYECIYDRSCDLFPSVDSYGGEHRTPIREPDHFKHARTRPIWAGGLYPLKNFPGTDVSTRQRLTPDQRYRRCQNPDGFFSSRSANPFPLAAFCNLFTRTDLDQPIDLYLTPVTRGRAGFVHQQITQQLLRAARANLGDETYNELVALPALDTPGDLALNNSIARGLLADIARAERAGADTTALQAELDALAFTSTGGLANTYAETQNARIDETLFVRSDPDRFDPLDRANNAGIGRTLWGASQFTDTIVPWLTEIGFHVRPTGYFTAAAIDGVNQSAIGLADNFVGVDRATGVDLSNERGVDQIPFFTGPDGIRNTEDDLPTVRCPGLTDDTAVGGRCIGGADNGANEPLYYVVPLSRHPTGGTSWDRASCDSIIPADLATGTAGGLNGNGECIVLSTNGFVDAGGNIAVGGGDRSLAALDRLLDPSNRPEGAFLDPAAVTDFKIRAAGARLPARPRAPGGGLYYRTRGVRDFQRSSHDYVSNLDVDFTEDELKWEHGAGQDEHEFSEGYLEFEFLDSQVFARAGKLITVWGKTELFRNQDRINPVDIGLGTLSRLEESRLGQWALQTIISPEMFMRVGPFEDLRLELVGVFDEFEPTDLGECGEGQTFELVCQKTFGALAAGLAGIGLVGEDRPDENWTGFARMDFGARIEGRFDRFTFAVSDFWGWEDAPFVLETVNEYSRRVDPETGAPVNSFGPLNCKIREDDEGRAIGPDAVRDTTDDTIPSVGNCLLFDNPRGDEPQTVRAEDLIALNHYANQTLFHTICSLTFDEDSGQCAVDILNEYTLFDKISAALGGSDLISGLAADGYETVRPPPADPNDPFDKQSRREIGKNVLGLLFGDLADPNTGVKNEAIFRSTTPEQRALLGCGEAFLSACDETQAGFLRSDPGYRAIVNLERPELLRGGIDFMNADASVLTQEFTVLKALSQGALVGTRRDPASKLRFEAGISHGTMSPLEAAEGGVGSWQVVREEIAQSLDLDGDGQPDGLSFSQLPAGSAQLRTATDFNIEPAKWKVDESFLFPKQNKGLTWIERLRATPALVFQDPRGPNGIWDGGIGDGTAEDIDGAGPDTDDVFDPLGEDCIGIFNQGTPDVGCTALEVISANIERLTMAGEVIGADRVFDPPETFAEIMAMLDNDPTNDLDGDPVAGADGIRYNNFDAGGVPDRVEDGIDERGDQKAVVVAQNNLWIAVDSFSDCLRGTTLGGSVQLGSECFLNLDRTDIAADAQGVRATRRSANRLVAALPIGLRLTYLNTDGTLVSTSPSADQQSAAFPLQRLSATDIQKLVVSGEMTVSRDIFTQEELAQLQVALGGATIPETFIVRGQGLLRTFFEPQGGYDIDLNAAPDSDEDNDRTFDFLDDGLFGPVSDDNILCGSGVPGDLLQRGAQHELDNEQTRLLLAEFPSGLPPRSPLFCRAATGLLGVTGQTLPIVRAGGDGRFGRRDFLWHSGRQAVITYQKLNVLGFSLDFAEDVTKTSWGIEFSATSDKLIPNADDYSNYSSSNDYVLSISIDRPTFFNFLNPNRSFFVNFQFFLRYLDDYKGGHGGSDNKDGNFAAAMGPITGLVTLTMFTGYFQDRLNPRFTLVFDPTTSTGGLITGLGYRFTESFSTAFSVNHFFGHHVQTRGAAFPFAPYTSPDVTSDGFRGLAPVTNRDEIAWVVRYSF